jgi:hypothetical protein
LNIPGLFRQRYKVLPPHAERALAPISLSSCGIGSIINSWAIDSIANPHLNNDLGTIIAFPGETFGQARSFLHLLRIRRLPPCFRFVACLV